jgi:hypothetical protein
MATFFWVFAFTGDAPDDEAGDLGTPPTKPQGAPARAEARTKKNVVYPRVVTNADADGMAVKIRLSPLMFDEMIARAYVTYPPCSNWYHSCANAVLIQVGD